MRPVLVSEMKNNKNPIIRVIVGGSDGSLFSRMDVHEHPHMHFDFTFVLLLPLVYLETSTVFILSQFGQINVAIFDLSVWTVKATSSSPTKIHFINNRTVYNLQPVAI